MELCSLICPSVSAALISGNVSKGFEHAAVQAVVDISACQRVSDAQAQCISHQHAMSAAELMLSHDAECQGPVKRC